MSRKKQLATEPNLDSNDSSHLHKVYFLLVIRSQKRYNEGHFAMYDEFKVNQTYRIVSLSGLVFFSPVYYLTKLSLFFFYGEERTLNIYDIPFYIMTFLTQWIPKCRCRPFSLMSFQDDDDSDDDDSLDDARADGGQCCQQWWHGRGHCQPGGRVRRAGHGRQGPGTAR